MKITFSLSSRTDESGMSEVLLRTVCRINGRPSSLRAKSSIFISKEYFDDKDGIKSLTNRHLKTPDVIYHIEQGKKLTALIEYLNERYHIADKEKMKNRWLYDMVDRYNRPEKYAPKVKKVVRLSIYDLSEIYITKKDFSTDHTKALRVLFRDVARYEGFIRMTEKNRKKFTFDYGTITKNDIEDFADYLKNEYALAKEYPDIFKKLFNDYPTGISKGQSILEERGENTIIKLIRKLKAFFQWLYETDKTKNRPFEGVKIGAEKFGTPYYITIDERNEIADYDFTYSKHLETQRDIFIFHCFVGCRVGDLEKFTDENIINGILVYAPHKTKDEGEQTLQARVPLHPRALALIEKYRGADKFGRLFPFISAQKYNVAIKDIFTKVGITRNVVVRNATTGENEIRPINEIASSHLARRTFIGNAYKQVSDPNIIGRMSGHVEGSRAFTRYRNIEDDTLMNVINKLG